LFFSLLKFKIMTVNQTEAYKLLVSSKTPADRAKEYVSSVKRKIQETVISPLRDNVESLRDKIADKKEFTLKTDHNAGMKLMTREEATARFKEIIDFEYELKLAEMELETKENSFKAYFGE